MRISGTVWFVIGVILIDCLLPFVLAFFYPEYNHMTMVLSSLGAKKSPVHKIYNLWMACLGISFVYIAIHLYTKYKEVSPLISLILLIITLLYAVFDCMVSSIFAVGETKNMVTLSEKIHGYGSAVGCTLFLFSGLLAAILLWREHRIAGMLMIVCFFLSLVTFGLFVAGDNVTDNIKGFKKILIYGGLWQRVSFVFMYFPYIVLSYFKS